MYNHKKIKMDKIITRKDEIIFSTNKTEEMLGKYLASPLKRIWEEDFVDEDTGQVVQIERSEMIAEQGQLITQDKLTEISFLLQTGDIKEIKVSNLQRQAIFSTSSYQRIYSITAGLNGKKNKFLLYANNIDNAIEIAKDFIELNYTGRFFFSSIKEIENCIIIDRKLTEVESNTTEKDKNYYKIIASIIYKDENENENEDEDEHGYEHESTFITFAKDVDSCMVIINNYIWEKIQKENKGGTFETKVKSGVIIPCNKIIDIEFSLAYSDKSDNN